VKTDRRSIFALDRPDMEALMASLEQPAYRVRQVLHHVYRHVGSLSAMTDLPGELRRRLADHVRFPALAVSSIQHDPAGPTDKFMLSLDDGARVEAVVMGNRGRPPTLCVSSQVGCPLGCRFCATGLMGFKRNLTFEELFGQVWLLLGHVRRAMGLTTTPNVVFMGMGEPLLNRRNLFATLAALTDPDRVGMGDRHITISTIGIPEGIRELAGLDPGVNLALSLHHPEEGPRRELMPYARAPLADVMGAITEYARVTKRLVTFEYVLLAGVNDSAAESRAVVRLVRTFRHAALVNLIPFNPVEASSFTASTKKTTMAFLRVLRSSGIRATVRRTQGRSIDAACGQLALRGFPVPQVSVPVMSVAR
jgi:23S rRNA (adenine2503-C2)-methyltransferase